MKKGFSLLVVLLSFMFMGGPVQARDVVKIGTTIDLSGYYGGVGKKFLKGYQLAFQEANEEGGINGRKIDFVFYDNNYNPDKAARDADRLVLEDKVNLLFSVFGTPPNVFVTPRLSVLKVPSVFPVSGAIFLYNQPWVFTFLPSYQDESAGMIRLIKKAGFKKVGIVYLPNLYGWDCRIGATREARKLGIPYVYYPMKSPSQISEVIKGLREANVDALYLIIPYKFLVPFLKAMDGQGYHPAIYTEYYCQLVRAFKEGLTPQEARGFGTLVTGRFLPMLYEDYPCIDWYMKALAKYSPGEKPDPTIFVGYVLAHSLVELLRHVSSFEPTQLVKELESVKNLDVGLPEKLSYGPGDHVGLSKIYFYKLVNGSLVPLE